jgi:hypothetical protein
VLDVLNPPNFTGSFAFATTGTNSPTVTGSGNALASLLLGQVNAFTIEIQKQVIQPRAHIAEFFIGDDWKVSLAAYAEPRYPLRAELPLDGEARSRGRLQPEYASSGLPPYRPRAGVLRLRP